MPRVLVDIEPMRVYPAFKRLWIGFAVSQLGSQLSVVAVSYEVYHLTGSNLDVGLISLFQLFPTIIGGTLGGSIADAIDRKLLLLVTSTAMAVLSTGLALDTGRLHPSLLLIYLLAAANAGFQGASGPALTSVLFSIVERPMMAKANALRTLSQQIASVVGPSLGGVLIAAAGVHVAFWVNAATFMVSFVAVLTIGSYPPQGGGTRFGLNSITEGFAFLKGRPAIQGCFIADLNATILGMPTALFPALAAHHFHGGSVTLGLLYAAPGIGSTIGSALSGWVSHVRLPGRAVVIAIVIWGLGIIGFGLAPWLPLAVLLIAIAGGADVISAIFRSTIIQTETPDRLRGRLSSIQLMVVTSGPRLGNTEGGLVAAATNAQFSVVSGGLGCVVGIGIIAKLLPQFLKYELPSAHPETVVLDEVEEDKPAGA